MAQFSIWTSITPYDDLIEFGVRIHVFRIAHPSLEFRHMVRDLNEDDEDWDADNVLVDFKFKNAGDLTLFFKEFLHKDPALLTDLDVDLAASDDLTFEEDFDED